MTFFTPATTNTLRYSLLAAVMLLVPLQVAASDMSAGQQDAIRKLVREYLLANPEVIVEAMGVYEKRQADNKHAMAKAAVDAMAAELFNTPQDPIMGNPDGDVAIVEFFDYQCGYCKRVAGPLFNVVGQDGNIKLVMKELPILGPASKFAAKAALAAKAQGAYGKFHTALLAHRGRLSDEIVLEIAADIDLDVARLKRDMKAPAVTAIINANKSLAAALNIRGTPAFIIGTELVPGAIDGDGFRRLIAKARQAN